MANINSAETDHRINKFAGAPLDVLAGLIHERTNAMFEKFNIIECVARGGESQANSINEDGNPIDSISGGIFSSIINTANDMTGCYELRAAVTELRGIAAQQPASV
jgi:hypothetical protein